MRGFIFYSIEHINSKKELTRATNTDYNTFRYITYIYRAKHDRPDAPNTNEK